mgnify:CR=1 FL=1
MPAGESVYKLLLIDDDPDFVAATKTVLESRHDYKVLTASDGVFGLAIAKAERPDLVILDVLMPREDGWHLLQQLQLMPETANIPVVICSVLRQPQLALALGAKKVLEKPVSQGALLQAVNELLIRKDSQG